MEHRVKVTVLDKKLFPELQAQYCAVPDSGKCPCYSVGDEFMFYRNDERDDFWHMGAGTLVKSGTLEEGCLQSLAEISLGTGSSLPAIAGNSALRNGGRSVLFRSVGCHQPLHLHGAARREHHARLDE